MKIAHIINPVVVGGESDLSYAQPITFESMRVARSYVNGSLDIELFACAYPEDEPALPEGFKITPFLNDSVLNCRDFKIPKKLPTLSSILCRMYECTDAEYLIYTNVDIGLMPYFYITVAQFIDAGIDAMVINRRTVAKTPCDTTSLPLMWAQVGEKHPGYDCFVFRRDAYSSFYLGNACIGANWIGRVLLANVHAHAENFRVLDDLHLTFHLGDDRSWKTPQFSDYDQHNQDELLKILAKLRDEGKFVGRPLLEKFQQDILNSRGAVNGVSKARRWWPFRCK